MERPLTDGQSLLGLRWAIKRSFLDYIERAPGGRVSLADGALATAEREIVFAPEMTEAILDKRLLKFRGSVRFSAYSSALLVPFSNPWLELEETRNMVTIADPFDPEGAARLELASFQIEAHVVSEGYEHWAAVNVMLTEQACPLFNNVYPASTQLEPFIVIDRA